ncbi:MAG TPA: hypothetical protein VLL52_25475 [Anaerolineae bacterium]|nr:hypothetical protein [Anaerolineae bacterium]
MRKHTIQFLLLGITLISFALSFALRSPPTPPLHLTPTSILTPTITPSPTIPPLPTTTPIIFASISNFRLSNASSQRQGVPQLFIIKEEKDILQLPLIDDNLSNDLKAISYTDNLAILVFMGYFRSGLSQFNITIQSTGYNNNILYLYAQYDTPPFETRADGNKYALVVTEAATAPYHLITIPKNAISTSFNQYQLITNDRTIAVYPQDATPIFPPPLPIPFTAKMP